MLIDISSINRAFIIIIIIIIIIIKICLCLRMLVLEWKETAFIEKVNSRCFCWFAAAILVHQNGTPIWRLHTKLCKGAWNVSANNSETVCHKDQKILVFYNISFLGFFHWTVFNLFFVALEWKRSVRTLWACQWEVDSLVSLGNQ